jgi:hypothetical protein
MGRFGPILPISLRGEVARAPSLMPALDFAIASLPAEHEATASALKPKATKETGGSNPVLSIDEALRTTGLIRR